MKTFIRVLGASLMTGLLLLASLGATAGAHSLSAKPSFRLPLSPVSGGVLVAQAIHSGKIQLPRYGAGHSVNAPNLTVLPNVKASTNPGTQPVNEDPVATNPANNSQLLTGGNDYNCNSLQGFYASGDGGATFNHTCMNLLPGASGDGDPGVGYDTTGKAYITGIDAGTADGFDIAFESSTNNGATWSAPKVAVKPFFTGGLTDKEWLQIDTNASSPRKNALYISVTQFDSSQTHDTISVSHSTNGGTSFTTVAVDATQTLSATVDQFSDITVGKDGTVYVTWLRCPSTGPTGDCGGTVSKMYFSKSTDGGNTWSTPAVAATVTLAPDSCGAYYGCLPNTSERVSNIPAIGVDNSTGANAGHLYVALYTYASGRLIVKVTTSTNGGTTWNTPKKVAPKTATHDEFFQWLTVSSNGVVGVTWLDRRNDPSNLSYEAFAATSTNGGGFGTHNHQIATVASNPLNDGFGGGFMGDYTGNSWSADGTHLFASWMDSRGGSVMQDEIGGITYP